MQAWRVREAGVRDQYREATWRGSKDVWVELADLDDCKLIPVCHLGNKLDGERRRLVRSKRHEVSDLKVDCSGFCYQTK